jgi:hypothetical protein
MRPLAAMSVNEKQIEFLARALVNRLEDRGLVEFHDADAALEVVVRALVEGLREADEEDGGER